MLSWQRSKHCEYIYIIEGDLDKKCIFWYTTLVDGVHNHDLDSFVRHSFHCHQALTSKVKKKIKQMLNLGISARQVLANLQNE